MAALLPTAMEEHPVSYSPLVAVNTLAPGQTCGSEILLGVSLAQPAPRRLLAPEGREPWFVRPARPACLLGILIFLSYQQGRLGRHLESPVSIFSSPEPRLLTKSEVKQ